MKVLFIITFILEVIFSLGFMLLPVEMMDPYAVVLDATATVMVRLFGSALLIIPVVLWFALKASSAELKKAVVYGLSAYYLVSGIVVLQAQLAGMMNALGWVIVGLHTVLFIGFGYFVFKGVK